jgi:hypothetical protein
MKRKRNDEIHCNYKTPEHIVFPNFLIAKILYLNIPYLYEIESDSHFQLETTRVQSILKYILSFRVSRETNLMFQGLIGSVYKLIYLKDVNNQKMIGVPNSNPITLFSLYYQSEDKEGFWNEKDNNVIINSIKTFYINKRIQKIAAFKAERSRKSLTKNILMHTEFSTSKKKKARNPKK